MTKLKILAKIFEETVLFYTQVDSTEWNGIVVAFKLTSFSFFVIKDDCMFYNTHFQSQSYSV